MNHGSVRMRPPCRWQRVLGRWGAAAALAGALALAANRADATVTIQPDVERTKDERSTSKFPDWISYSDCVNDNDLTFTITLQGYSESDTLTVWVSETADCASKDEREPGGSCKQVFSRSNLDATMDVTVSVKSIAEALGAGRCDDPGPSTSPRSVAIYFMRQVSSDEETPDNAKWDGTKMDLLGPRPPTDVKAGVGDARLVVSYTQSDDADTRGYYFYCDENGRSIQPSGAGGGAGAGDGPGGGGSGGGGTGGAGGAAGAAGGGGGSSATSSSSTGGASDTGGSCSSSVLTPGESPERTYLCGSVGRASQGEVTELTNGLVYAVGVAAYDNLDNAGALSRVACGVPLDVDDFFEMYRDAGGGAGGGFCSIGLLAEAGPMTAGAVVAAAALGLRRVARRRRSARSSKQEHA